MSLKLRLRILSPKRTIFEGEAEAVSSINVDGKFDILPQHANFITLVEKNAIVVRVSRSQKHTFNFERAIIYIAQDFVNIYTEIEKIPYSPHA